MSDVFYRSTLKIGSMFTGHYRYKDVFQILQSKKGSSITHGKYIEFNDKYMMNRGDDEYKNVQGQGYGHLDLLQELIALLQICTNQPCELDTDDRDVRPSPQEIIEGFTPIKEPPFSFPIRESNSRILFRMNPGMGFLEIQSQAGAFFESYFSLDEKSRVRINSSLFLQHKMRKILLISASMAIVGYISSIENLVDFDGERNGFETTKCKLCQQPVYSITRRFKEFMEKYSEDNFKKLNEKTDFYHTEPEYYGVQGKKLIGEFYTRRSKITHAGDILAMDKVLSKFSMKDVRFFNEVETHARIALFSYILNFHSNKLF